MWDYHDEACGMRNQRDEGPYNFIAIFINVVWFDIRISKNYTFI